MKIHEAPIERKTFPTRGMKMNPTIYMEQKVQRDSQLWDNDNSNLWIVENKLYDLSSFVDKHPGGSSWISITKGQDITQHFIVHHLRQAKAREHLKEYYVGECKNQVTRFSFEKDGLYRRVKEKVLEKFSVEQIQDETRSKFYGKILLGLFAIFLTLTAYYQSYLSAAVCSFLLLGIMGIGHNFVHHRDNLYTYFILLAGFTHHQWRVMHCVSHHMYPNLQIDYEAAAFEPISYYLRSRPNNFFFIEIILQVVYFFLQPTNMTLKLVVLPILKLRKPDFFYAVPLLVPILFYAFNGNIFSSIKLYLFLYGIFGLAMGRTLFCGHRLQQLWTEGAQKIEDFGEHTVCTTNDSDVHLGGFASYTLTCGFNVHTPHHFFPTADHAILIPIMDIIQETCKQMGIQYHRNNRLACFKSLSKGLVERKQWVKQIS